MYAKIFAQIFDSSIAEDPELRFTFMDMLVLADLNGVVDMTHEAIARRTVRPLAVIQRTIAKLEAPDSRSRTDEENGRRLKRLDAHRDWGWLIINYERFKRYVTEDHRRAKTRERVRRYRARVTNGNTPVTLSIGDSVTPPSRKKRHTDVDVDVDVDKHLSPPSAARPAAKRPPPTETPGAINIGALWIDVFKRERDNVTYPLTGRDKAAIKQLGEMYPSNEDRQRLKGIFVAYLEDNDPWLNKKGWPLFEIVGRTQKYDLQASTEVEQYEDPPEDLAEFGATA